MGKRDDILLQELPEKAVENSGRVALSPNNLTRARAFAPNNLRVDWFRVMIDLKNEGYSLYAVSHFTGIPRITIHGYKQGLHQPPYHHGVCLLQFWAEVTERDTTEAPTISPYSFKA